MTNIVHVDFRQKSIIECIEDYKKYSMTIDAKYTKEEIEESYLEHINSYGNYQQEYNYILE